MTAAGARREGLWIIGRRIERPEAILLSLVMAGLVVYGWFAPSFWLAVARVTKPISSGPTNEVTLPVSANSPKCCAIRSFGAK